MPTLQTGGKDERFHDVEEASSRSALIGRYTMTFPCLFKPSDPCREDRGLKRQSLALLVLLPLNPLSRPLPVTFVVPVSTFHLIRHVHHAGAVATRGHSFGGSFGLRKRSAEGEVGQPDLVRHHRQDLVQNI